MDVPEADVAPLPVVLADHRKLLLGIDAPGLEVDGDRACQHPVQRPAPAFVRLGAAGHQEEQGVEAPGRLQELPPTGRLRQEVEERLGVVL